MLSCVFLIYKIYGKMHFGFYVVPHVLNIKYYMVLPLFHMLFISCSCISVLSGCVMASFLNGLGSLFYCVYNFLICCMKPLH
jgi:hypothetical protein